MSYPNPGFMVIVKELEGTFVLGCFHTLILL
jgi:hypothetical protein